jgi:hypothetical protein
MDSSLQVSEPTFQVLSIFFPPHAVYSGRCLPLQAGVALPQQFDRDMVQQGGEPQLPIFTRCLAHTLQPLWPASPTRRVWHGCGCCVFSLVRGLPSTTSAGRLPALVRLLRRYYAAVRLPTVVRGGLAALRVLLPVRGFSPGRRRDLPVLAHGVSQHAWGLRLRRVESGLTLSSALVWPSVRFDTVGTRGQRISELNTQPADAPVQRFKCGLAATLAWLGVRVVRYSFPVRQIRMKP